MTDEYDYDAPEPEAEDVAEQPEEAPYYGPGRHHRLPDAPGPENLLDRATAPVPPPDDQPGLGRAANPERDPSSPPARKQPASRIGEKLEQAGDHDSDE